MVMFYPAARFVTHSIRQTNRLTPLPEKNEEEEEGEG
jgi:hypothetical protein